MMYDTCNAMIKCNGQAESKATGSLIFLCINFQLKYNVLWEKKIFIEASSFLGKNIKFGLNCKVFKRVFNDVMCV